MWFGPLGLVGLFRWNFPSSLLLPWLIQSVQPVLGMTSFVGHSDDENCVWVSYVEDFVRKLLHDQAAHPYWVNLNPGLGKLFKVL
ncbi:hypothetical protein Mrub_2167 [Meiothermus ruber DSM 1279]|uniref:Uncharacterized protein n=1 Tax=Meiothermus ruber (strain ATCC 35948 / DSM 1279 / VKM B-1258 / 21) TaxID=504728 RepID=A0A806CV73_MEIRD|nr:hypothetical protein Mrub_2167 [Meiothermus ruber DSM 1279]